LQYKTLYYQYLIKGLIQAHSQGDSYHIISV